MRVLVITPPATDVVTLDEVKEHLRLDESDEDAFLQGALEGAIAHIDGPDGWLGRALGLQTLELRHDIFWSCPIRRSLELPCRPIRQIDSVKYLDAEGAEQTLAPSSYELAGNRLLAAYGETWPALRVHTEAVRVRYQAGYDVLPRAIRSAILLMVGDLYKNRSTVSMGANSVSRTPMSTTVENLLAPFRVFD